MPKIDRAKLKRLLRELDSEKIRAAGKKVKEVGVAAGAKVGAVVEEQRRVRTPESRTHRAIVGRSEQVERQKREALTHAERQKELEALRAAKTAEEQRKRVEHEIFEEKYGEQIRKAKTLGRGIAAGTAVLGKGIAGLGKGVAREFEHQEELTHKARREAAERKTIIRKGRREDIQTFLESEGVTRKEVRQAQQPGDMFDFPEIDIGL